MSEVEEEINDNMQYMWGEDDKGFNMKELEEGMKGLKRGKAMDDK